MNTLLANLACYAFAAWEALLFRRGTKRVRDTQEKLLAKILKDNTATIYGRQYGFEKISSCKAYQACVPLVDYSAISAYIEKIASGEKDVLFRGVPLCMQPTSGTTSAAKLIPFTAGLKNDYQRAVSPWIFDMQSHLPALLTGKAYWSLSPVLSENTRTTGGVHIGFLDDTEYLTYTMGALLRKSFAVPTEVGLIQDTGLFRYLTMAFLLKSREFTFVSVWNPTFFMLLLDSLWENGDSISDDIERGELSRIASLPDHLRGKLAQAFSGAAPERGAEIRNLLTEFSGNRQSLYPRLWPKLTLISCWEDGEAKSPALRLRGLFPGVMLQAKGLMATEAVVSIPLVGLPFALLAVRSHFFEFIPLEKDDEIRTAWELEKGGLYTIVVTTSAGLYRYRLGDVVKVRGFYNDCPMLEFIGRGNHISDFYGEKLHQFHVSEVIASLFAEVPPSSRFVLLAPDGNHSVERYTLYVAADQTVDSDWLESVGTRFDMALRSNFHYDYCRRLGQLQEVSLFLVNLDVNGATKKFMEEMTGRGIREGDIKPTVLDNRPVWSQVFGAHSNLNPVLRGFAN